MKTQAVIGCGFGDEGKGRVVSYLCSKSPEALIVRFSGGHQAAHHVMLDKEREHVFSNFGSGTLQGNPTYWSEFCTIDPKGILNELDILLGKGIKPKLYIDRKCPVTTLFDKEHNKLSERFNAHGSCGVGFGQTLKREQKMYSLLFEDLFHSSVLKIKFDLIRNYYGYPSIGIGFLETCQELINSPYVHLVNEMPVTYPEIIFEGSQGLLLDQNIGFFPNVTRSNTDLTNIWQLTCHIDEVLLVTRAYQTRHGNGPMTNEHIPHKIKKNPYEQNPDDGLQGKFRTSLLDLDLLKYAINKTESMRNANKKLVVTCLDLVENDYRLTVNNDIVTCSGREDLLDFITSYLDIEIALVGESPFAESMV